MQRARILSLLLLCFVAAGSCLKKIPPPPPPAPPPPVSAPVPVPTEEPAAARARIAMIAEPATLAGKAFKPACDVPFGSIGEVRDIDDICSADGAGSEKSKAQNRVKNNVRMQALQLARQMGAVRVGVGTFKGRQHLHLDLGREPAVFNNLKLDQGARAAEAIKRKAIPSLKTAARATWPPEILDYKVTVAVRNMNALREFDTPQVETVTMYVPVDQMKKFLNADITTQQLVDGSIVLLNDDRVQVSLGGS